MIKILICDDDEKIINQIDELIESREKYKETELLVDKKCSGDFILSDKTEYDIAFVDVEMPGIGGLKLAEKLKENNPDTIVIIITSFPDYLDNAMKIKVFRYLSKPIKVNRFYNGFYDALREYYNISKTIIIDLKTEVVTVKTKDILYLETKKYGSNIITRKGSLSTNKKVKDWLTIIDQPNCFINSHNSFVVNLQNVIDFNSSSVTIRKNDKEVITTYMSKRKFNSFKKSFFSFSGGQV